MKDDVSFRESPAEMAQVFISYSRKDGQFVRSLSKALENYGRDIWVDWEDIPLSSKWLAEIESAIEAADTFIFVISPDSVASEICKAEVRHAAQYAKKFIPIVRREIAAETALPELADWQWLFLRAEDDFDAACESLLEALDTDLAHVRMHTRLLVRAREWEERDHPLSRVLRGKDLQEARSWLKQCGDRKPQPTDLHREYVESSQRAVSAMRGVQMIAGVVVVALAYLAFSYFQSARYEAMISRHEAYATSLNLAEAAYLDDDHEGAIEALRQQMPHSGDEDLREFAWRLLWHRYDNHRHAVFVSGATTSVAISSDSRYLAITSGSHTVTVWNLETGELSQRLEDKDQKLFSAVFTEDGTRIATGGDGAGFDRSPVKSWAWRDSASEPEELSGMTQILSVSPDSQILLGDGGLRNLQTGDAFPLKNLMRRIRSGPWAFSPDSRLLAVANRGILRLVDTLRGQETQVTLPRDLSTDDICFARQGGALAIGGAKGGLYRLLLLDVALGEEILYLDGPETDSGLLVSLHCSGDGRKVAMLVGSAEYPSAEQHNRLLVWDVVTGKHLFTLDEADSGFITAFSFSPDSAILATGGRDHAVRLWDASTGMPRSTLGIHHGSQVRPDDKQRQHRDTGNIFSSHEVSRGGISHLAYSRDGRTLVTASRVYGTVMTWDASGPPDDYPLPLPLRADHILATAFAPDGLWIATGDQTGTIALWDAATFEKLSEAKAGAAVRALAFSPDGSMFVAATADDILQKWRTDPLAKLATLDTASSNYSRLFSELFVGQRVLIHVEGSERSERDWNIPLTIRVWDLTGEHQPIDLSANQLAVAQEGSQLAVLDGCEITVWDLERWTSEVLLSKEDCSGLTIRRITLSPNGVLLAAGGPKVKLQEGQPTSGIRLFDLTRPGASDVLALPVGNFYRGEALQSLEFSPDGLNLAVVSAAASDMVSLASSPGALVTVWDMADYQRVAALELPTDKMCRGYYAASCARLGGFSPDSQVLAVVRGPRIPYAGKSEIILWHWESGEQVTALANSRVDKLIFSVSEQHFVTLFPEWPAVVWDRESLRAVAALGNYKAWISTIRDTPDRLLALSGERTRTNTILARVWDLSTGELLLSQDELGPDITGPARLSPDGRRLAVERGDDGVLIWDLAQERIVSTLVAGKAFFKPFSPDGRMVITRQKDRLILWDASTGDRLHEFEGVPPIAFSLLADTLATTGVDHHSAIIWKLDGRKPRLQAELPASATYLAGLEFAPDGKSILSLTTGSSLFGNVSAEARLWSARSGDLIAELRGYNPGGVSGAGFTPVSGAGFAPDGKTLATVAEGGLVHLWDPVTGRQLMSLQGLKQGVRGLQFSADGQSLAVGYSSAARVWRAKASSYLGAE